MGHNLRAVIGRPENLGGFATRWTQPGPTDLPFGLQIIPLDERRMDELATFFEPSFEGFDYLNITLSDALASVLTAGPAIYIETDYFGGSGGQGAALFRDGALRWTASEKSSDATAGQSPISRALAELGVERGTHHDEFDAVGLVQYRSVESLGIEYDDDED